MAYTSVFGGSTIYPSDVSYLALELDADVTLEWPLESSGEGEPAARIIDVVASGSYDIAMPDATQTGAGQTVLFNNLPSSTSSFNVVDAAGNTLVVIAAGEQWQVYLSDTSTVAGAWRVFRFGASTASVQASALAGYGITPTSNTLSQSFPVTVLSSSPYTATATDRASAFVWDGSGAATFNLPQAVTAGNNFFIAVRNAGGGDMTIDPAGGELINGSATLALRPNDSAIIVTDGIEWFTLGYGQEAVFAFDYTSIDLTGQASPYVLAGSELNRVAYKFIGTLTANMVITVPPTIQQYWVDNDTSGAYTLSLNTASGTPVAITQGARGIYYCDGSNVVNASTAGISVPLLPAEGGTGLVSYAVGDILYASGATTINKLSDIATGNALLSGGVGVAPAYGKVDLTTTVTGTLPFGNGGTGHTAYTNGQILIGNTGTGALDKTTLTAGSGITITNGAGTITIESTAAGVGTVTSVAGSGGTTGMSFTGGPITGAGTLTLTGTLAVANGGTNATNATDARTSLAAAGSGAVTASGITMSTARILGRTTASTGAIEEITIGSGLSLSAGTLTNTAGGTGTVTSVDVSGGTTGITSTGGPVTTTGTITLGGTLAVAHGGTGVTTSTGSGANVLSASPTLTGTTGMASATTSGTMGLAAGTAAAPSLMFTSDTDTGIYRVGANQLGVATGGSNRVTIDSTGVTVGNGVIAGYMSAPTGTAASPVYTITGDLNTGMYSTGADQLGFSTGGTSRISITTTAITATLPISGTGFTGTGVVDLAAGSAALPAYTFTGDPNTGVYNIGADQLGFSTGGTLRLTVSTTAVTSTLPVYHPDGAIGSPSVTFTSDTDTGMYRIGANALGLVVGGASAFTCNGSISQVYHPLTIGANQVVITTTQTPASAAAAGTTGTICWDANYIYVCTASGAWKRVAIATW